jgi:DNA-binding CsgD family transcriptional regulator
MAYGHAVSSRADTSRPYLDAWNRARPLLGEHEDLGAEPATDLRTLDAQLAVLAGLLGDRLQVGTLSPERFAEVSHALQALSGARLAILEHLAHERARRLEAVDTALAELRGCQGQDELLQRVCPAAVASCGFDRVMLSRVDDNVWRPWRSHARDMGSPERTFADWIGGLPAIRLRDLLLECDMVRRGRPVIVLDAQRDSRVYAPLVEASGLTSYVAAPVLAGDRVIGLLHADRVDGEVDELDREVLWVFSVGVAQIHERVVLQARLREQHLEVVRAMRAIEAVLERLSSAEIQLAGPAPSQPEQVTPPGRTLAVERQEALARLLTTREMEVLAIMATGATNERIADQLVIATGTVKTHVKQILRKLRADNRAEAISRYLRLTISVAGQ